MAAREIQAELDAEGLPPGAQSLIAAVLARHPVVAAAVLFGSRAKGNHRPESDIDLMLEGALTPLDAQRIAAELEELPVPQKFDVRARSGIQSPDMLDHIRRVGRVVYRRG